jgi:hypothetical protein
VKSTWLLSIQTFKVTALVSALIEFALDWMKDAGMSIAMVETGGDPGHAQHVTPMKRRARAVTIVDTSRSSNCRNVQALLMKHPV